MMVLTGFEDVTRLDLADRRLLLREGRPEERVWAAWSLGLQLGVQAVAELRAAFDREDNAGVRRHLVIILAGLGERSLLDALMRDEADDAVRATATQYALQIGAGARVRPLVDAILRDPSAQVRRALLVADGAVGAVLSVNDLVALAADPDREVRELAIEAVARELPPEELFPGPLEDRTWAEPDVYLRKRLMRLAIAGGRSHRLLAMAEHAPTALTLELLEELAEGRQYFRWRDLASVAARDLAAADYSLALLLDEQDSAAARGWLLARLLRALRSPYPPERSDIERANFSARCYALLEGALRAADLSSFGADDQEIMDAIMADLEQFKRQMDEVAARYPAADPRLDWMRMPHIQVRLRVLERLRALGVQPRATGDTGPGTGIVPATSAASSHNWMCGRKWPAPSRMANPNGGPRSPLSSRPPA